MEVKSEICKSKGKRWYKETVCMYFMPSFWKSRESLDESEITHRGKRRVDPVLFLLYWEAVAPIVRPQYHFLLKIKSLSSFAKFL